MKVSFLIPSKNRLELLRHAISSILAQDYLETEIVVSDNASSEDYRSYIDEIADRRIIYSRPATPVPVTENWRNALSLSTGDYVIMLGDDDALAPNFIETVAPFLSSDGPDLVYLAAYHYAYPNVLDFKQSGYLASVRNSEFFANDPYPFCVTKKYARELAISVLDFRYRFGFNAQHFLLKASFVKKFDADGTIYQSPYPDTFAAVFSFFYAKSIVVVPSETIIIGISPKSFGFYYFSNELDEGYKFLDNEHTEPAVRESLRHEILPGDRNNTNWLVAAETARRAIAPHLDVQLNFGRYRILQMMSVLRDCYQSRFAIGDALIGIKKKLSPVERMLFELLETAIQAAERIEDTVRTRVFTALDQQLEQFFPAKITFLDIGDHRNIQDAFSWLASRGTAPAGETPAEPRPSATGDVVTSQMGPGVTSHALLMAERDKLATERDLLTAERDRLTADYKALSIERDRIREDRDVLRSRMETLKNLFLWNRIPLIGKRAIQAAYRKLLRPRGE